MHSDGSENLLFTVPTCILAGNTDSGHNITPSPIEISAEAMATGTRYMNEKWRNK